MYVLVRAEILAEITFWKVGILIWTGFFLLGKKLDYDTRIIETGCLLDSIECGHCIRTLGYR